MDNLPHTHERNEVNDAGSVPERRGAESLTLLTDALARTTQYHAQTVELNRSMVQIKDVLAEAIVAFSSIAESTIRTEDRLHATAEKLEASTQLFASKQQELLRALNYHSRRFTTLLTWTLVLATLASAAAFIGIFFSILTGR